MDVSGAKQLDQFADRMGPLVDSTVEGLGRRRFREDPIAGRKYSRLTSIISSAYKRHGQMLGDVILERLRDCARFQVWREDTFKLSDESLQNFRAHDHLGKCLSISLAYGQDERSIPIDMIVFNTDTRILRSYNVKRGNGAYDAGKRRIILGELIRTNMLLKDYGRHMGLEVSQSEAKIIFYYGLRSIPEPLSLVGAELDDHFEFPVFGAVEAVNEYFRRALHDLIEHG